MSVELLSHFGSDLMVVNAARVSFGKESNEFTDRDAGLIRYLVKHKHTSVFRHPQLQFRIKCPIYVERQLFKHQIGLSANSISGRYVDFSFSHTPVDVWRLQSKSSKQGSEGVVDDQDRCKEIEAHAIETCKAAYDKLLSMGVAKEQARSILPLNLNTEFIWTGSLLAFIHLFGLRLKPDAQAETREVAQAMHDAITALPGNPFEHSMKSFKPSQP